MIKFFRRIRQRLLTENKTSKYLIYALGEILLVVIGILIALQVNNWNQSKINERKEIMLLEQFIIDLESDAVSVSQALDRVEEKKRITQYFYNEMNNIETSFDSFNLNNFTAGIRIPVSFKSKNQKFVDQISDKGLYNMLIEYMHLEERYREALNMGNHFIRNNARQYLGRNRSFNLDEIFGELPMKEVISQTGLLHNREQLAKLYSEGEFENILFNIRMNAFSIGSSGQTLLEMNEKLKQVLLSKIK